MVAFKTPLFSALSQPSRSDFHIEWRFGDGGRPRAGPLNISLNDIIIDCVASTADDAIVACAANPASSEASSSFA